MRSPITECTTRLGAFLPHLVAATARWTQRITSTYANTPTLAQIITMPHVTRIYCPKQGCPLPPGLKMGALSITKLQPGGYIEATDDAGNTSIVGIYTLPSQGEEVFPFPRVKFAGTQVDIYTKAAPITSSVKDPEVMVVPDSNPKYKATPEPKNSKRER